MLTFVNICIIIQKSIKISLIVKKEVMKVAEKKLVISSKKYTGETAVVSARLPLDLIKKLDEICEATGRTKNEVIQMCLEFSVDHIEIEG